VCQRSRKFLGDHEKSVRNICAALEAGQDLLDLWLSFCGEMADGFARRAHRDDLNPPRPVDREFREWVNRVETFFDYLLDRAERSYHTVFRVLGELLAKPNPDAVDLETLTRRIPSTVLAHAYFLDRLEHRGWLEPLKETALLTRVPPLEFDEAEGTVRLPQWPAAPYL
jgi:hypothetical protein